MKTERERKFKCSVCKRRVPWSKGAADDMPGACDDCWCKAHSASSPHSSMPK